MSADIAISVDGLSKKYRLGVPRQDTLRDRLVHLARGLVSPKTNTSTSEEFWALRDVSFQVKRGEVLGIIGRNGAGKSTLLKILSRITDPTAGRISLRGRVASLLEVGTGFHPELTGRENIFLNGAILGMSRAEIRQKFDAIVAFAEVERFLDTAVKHYSSGMYVRLAFAVAAHLEPEILIVDEVLAVGDAAFQQKCMGKIHSIAAGDGRTVLLVSHNMASVQQLCPTVLRLASGEVAGHGPALAEIQGYLGGHRRAKERQFDLNGQRRTLEPRGGARLQAVELRPNASATGLGPWQLPFGTELTLQFTIELLHALKQLELGIGIFTLQGAEAVSTLSSWNNPIAEARAGIYTVEVRFGSLGLALGPFRFGVGVSSDRGLEDYISDAFEIEVVPSEKSLLPKLRSIQGAIARISEVDWRIRS